MTELAIVALMMVVYTYAGRDLVRNWLVCSRLSNGLLDGHRFRQIARAVHVASAQDRNVVREKL